MIDMDQAQILAQLKGIIDQIAAAELLRESLPLSQWETLVASLQAQMHDLQIQLEGDGTIVVGSGNKVIGAGAIYIEHLTVQYSERLWSQLAAAHTPLPDLKKATAEYLTTLINKYRYLDFRGLGVMDRLPTQLSLLQMMVPLKARRLLPDGETWPRDETIDEEYDAVPVVDLLQAQDGLIVLGDPGSGKTTFLKYLMLMLATGDGDKIGLADRLPLAIPLSAYANALAEKDVPLDQFIETYHRGMGIDLPLDSMVREALNNGRALLLLDGLDEVIDERQRLLLIDHVLSFYALQRQRGNRFVMTSRLVGYGSTRPVADGLAECMLTDFDNDAIKAFVKRWSLVLAQAAQGDSAQAIVEANETAVNLTTAILHNPGIKQLATNPLLLTILVLMQRQGIVLPARRVELYEQYIATLIRHWNFARGLGRARSRDLDVIETLRVLAPLALWLQETNPGIGTVSQRVMQRQLAEIYHQRGMDEPERLAAQFLEDVRLYAGLLLVREPGEYGFLHRTFQEYLAALAIVQQGQRDPTPIIRKIVDHVNTDGWHEILRLAIGILGVLQQRDEVVADICERLIAEATGDSVVLAGDVVVDVWPGGVTMAGRTAVIHALQTTMKNEKISAPYRMGAAAALGRLSVDDMAVLPLTVTAVDQMPFCLVPNGSFWLGEADYRQYYEALAASYWIAQYPITNAQFAQFIADGGYQVPAFWTEAAAVERWQDGQVMDWESRGWRKRPFDYGDPFSLPNHPVVGICWYEALAFTRWLTQRWQAAGLLSMDGQIMLPSEVEWEKAARGGVDILNDPVVCEVAQVADEWDVILQENVAGKRPFPWGEAAPDNHAHFNVHHWRGTCAVGCYPSGASTYGCAGMSGNVWEWTRSLYEPFPYLPGDGRESTEIKLFHNLVLKGGAFWVDEKRIRCSSRFRRAPNDRFNNYGFRVVIKEGKGLSVED